VQAIWRSHDYVSRLRYAVFRQSTGVSFTQGDRRSRVVVCWRDGQLPSFTVYTFSTTEICTSQSQSTIDIQKRSFQICPSHMPIPRPWVPVSGGAGRQLDAPAPQARARRATPVVQTSLHHAHHPPRQPTRPRHLTTSSRIPNTTRSATKARLSRNFFASSATHWPSADTQWLPTSAKAGWRRSWAARRRSWRAHRISTSRTKSRQR